MRNKTKLMDLTFNIFNYLILLLLMSACVYPLLYVLFSSFSNEMLLMANEGPLFAPLGFTTDAYKRVLENERIISGYINTIIIVVVGTSINVFLTACGAYFLIKKDLMFKKVILFMILFSMYFSGGLIPMYFTVKGLGLENTIWAVIIPSAISTYNMIIMRTGFEAVPDSIEESAKIDGANDFVILFKMILPLALPTVTVITLYYIVGHWNSWFSAMIYIRDRAKQPLQLVLREIIVSNSTDSMTTWSQTGTQGALAETIKYATMMIATIPILCLYPFLQKYFIKGVMIGAVKG